MYGAFYTVKEFLDVPTEVRRRQAAWIVRVLQPTVEVKMKR